MSRRTDQEHLLADVLSPEPDSEFGAQVLAETLRGVRRQRRVRQLRRAGGLIVVLLTVGIISSHVLQRSEKSEMVSAPTPLNYQLVVSQPLAHEESVTTQPLLPDQSTTSIANVAMVKSVPGGFGEIGDDELLSLAAPQVVALVRRGPHEAELVFVSAPLEAAPTQQN